MKVRNIRLATAIVQVSKIKFRSPRNALLSVISAVTVDGIRVSKRWEDRR